MSNRKILVTGGAGYIGSITSARLRLAGFETLVFDNMSSGHDWAIGEGRLVRGDVLDTKALIQVMRDWKPDAVIHFAALIAAGESVEKPLTYYLNNVGGVNSVVTAMVEAGVPSIVFSSTASIFGSTTSEPLSEDLPIQPENPYASSKAMCETILKDACKAYGLKAIALRYFNAAGADTENQLGEAHEPETHLIPLVLEVASDKRKEITIYGTDYDTPDGTCVRDYVHVVDLAQAHIRALDRLAEGAGSNSPGGFETFNIGVGKGFSVKEVIDTCRDVTGHVIPTKVGQRREGDPSSLTCAPGKANTVLGWSPIYPELSDIISHAWAWEKDRRRLGR